MTKEITTRMRMGQEEVFGPAKFATAVQNSLPIKVIVIKNGTLGMIRWEQMAFLGNPEFGVEFSAIDWVKFAESCGGKGYAIKEPNEVKSIMNQAMKERNPTIIEAYVDPFEPPMPPKVEMGFVKEVAASFARGQPYTRGIGLTLFRDQVHNVLKNIHAHSAQSKKRELTEGVLKPSQPCTQKPE